MSRALVPLLLALAGCAMPTEGGRGFVLLDEAARNGGLAVETSGVRENSLRPISVAEGAPSFVLAADGQAEPLDVAPGEVVLVRGIEAYIDRWPLGTVRPDVLVASAWSEQPAADLARQIDADVLARDEQTFELVGPTVWEGAADLAADPVAIIELLPTLDDGTALPAVAEGTSLFVAPPPLEATLDEILPAEGAIESTDAALAQLVASGATGTAFGSDLTAPGLVFSTAQPGRYSATIHTTYSGGCSRSWTNGAYEAVVAVTFEADGTATACRTRSHHATTMSAHFDGMRMERSGYATDESYQQGYRGTWRRDGTALAVAFRADDSVCAKVVSGRPRAPETFTMTCAAVRGVGERRLPSGGLACSFPTVPGAWIDHEGIAIRALGGDYTLMGPGDGWDITTSSGRWSAYGELSVVAAGPVPR